ncbi:outer membrane lipoprotein-sorting protein [Herbaspirillum sp. HC18]|nr:outer membrane lipoprotein-sorting protein [Herbaspirillum sp. HC18]
MMQLLIRAVVLTAGVLAWPVLSHAELPADVLMKGVTSRYRGDTWVVTSNVVLIDQDNNRTHRKVRSINKKYGADLKSKNLVLEPTRLAGTAFLSYDWSGAARDDEAWIFLPELGRVTRLATGSRAEYFLGSDFTYGDLEEIKVEYFDFSYLEGEKVPEGQALVLAEPKDSLRDKVIERTGYQRIWYWVDKEKNMMVKAKYWLKDPGWIKYYTMSDIERIDGVWVGRREQMVLTQLGIVIHATALNLESMVINDKVDDAAFAPQNLGRSVK